MKRGGRDQEEKRRESREREKGERESKREGEKAKNKGFQMFLTFNR